MTTRQTPEPKKQNLPRRHILERIQAVGVAARAALQIVRDVVAIARTLVDLWNDWFGGTS